MDLFYPKWIPGEHSPTGPIASVVGMRFHADDQTLNWHRDPQEVFAFRVDVPDGVSQVQAEFDFRLTTSTAGFSSGASGTENVSMISWNQLLLYPRGRRSDDVQVRATLRLPTGWKYSTSLPIASASAERIDFQPVSLTTLIDSPVLAGRHFKTIALSTGTEGTHQIDIVADTAKALESKPDLAARYSRLVDEAIALFGTRHYRNYRWLVTLSDQVARFGLEHHESSDDRVPENTLIDKTLSRFLPRLLSHEYVHSWNGKHRRPAGLTTQDYEQPMRGDLLWVYEGLTEYLGNLLAVRSELETIEDYRSSLALTAARMQLQSGRNWRPLGDTAVAAQILYGAPAEWTNLRRSVDFYTESELIWLEVDTLIRRETRGQRSIDDFCKRFHGGQSGPRSIRAYTLEEMVTTLNEVAAFDWSALFERRIGTVAPGAPLGGIENSGWKLVYNETPNEWLRASEQAFKFIDLSSTLGLIMNETGSIMDLVPDSPADQAGVLPGGKIIAVNGRRFTLDQIRSAITLAKGTAETIELIVESGDSYRTHRIGYHEGERYPHLERDNAKPDMLADIARSRAR
jgi:predicted metalloprotease with PDZ domain